MITNGLRTYHEEILALQNLHQFKLHTERWGLSSNRQYKQYILLYTIQMSNRVAEVSLCTACRGYRGKGSSNEVSGVA